MGIEKMEMGIENLDCLPEDDLRKAANAYSLLSHYAQLKLAAVDARKNGRIIAAQAYEKQCEKLYARLPESMKW